jgi:hypothetical protein
LSRADKKAFVNLVVDRWVNLAQKRREQPQDPSRSEIRRFAKNLYATHHFGVTAPILADAIGAGRCLWLNPAEPSGSLFGNSHFWIGYRIDASEPVGVLEIPRGRVRAVDRFAFYVSDQDEDLVGYVKRFEIKTHLAC